MFGNVDDQIVFGVFFEMPVSFDLLNDLSKGQEQRWEGGRGRREEIFPRAERMQR